MNVDRTVSLPNQPDKTTTGNRGFTTRWLACVFVCSHRPENSQRYLKHTVHVNMDSFLLYQYITVYDEPVCHVTGGNLTARAAVIQHQITRVISALHDDLLYKLKEASANLKGLTMWMIMTLHHTTGSWYNRDVTCFVQWLWSRAAAPPAGWNWSVPIRPTEWETPWTWWLLQHKYRRCGLR